MKVSPSAIERFWAKVDRSAGPDGCWAWTGTRMGRGYGSFYLLGTTRPAHRVAYVIANGEIPAGLTIDHLCHTKDTSCPSDETCTHRQCVNPRHLEAVTNRENIMRGFASAPFTQAAKTHCPQGHPYNEANTMHVGKGDRNHRKCRICQKAAIDRFYARKRLAAAI